MSSYEKLNNSKEYVGKDSPVFTGSISLGRKEGSVVGENSAAFGNSTMASGLTSHAEGMNTFAKGKASHVEGSNLDYTGSSTLEDFTIPTEGLSEFLTEEVTIIGSMTAGVSSHAEGTQTYAHGYSSHTEGYQTKAFGDNSHAEGEGTVVIGGGSHAEGLGTTVSGNWSHAEGGYTTVSGSYSHAEGYQTIVDGTFCHAEGYGTISSGGEGSHSEGKSTTASGESSHAEGISTVASGKHSHAEGNNATASGEDSHAEGRFTSASGKHSHAEGHFTSASGDESHAEGYQTIAYGEFSHVQGKYNIEDTDESYAHIVGNGSSVSTRSNAHTLDWDGNAWFQGDVYVGSTSGKNKDNGSQKLATEKYVDENGGVFIAVYGKTTNAELDAAYQAGKAIFCKYNDHIYGNFRKVNDSTYWFTAALPTADNVKTLTCVQDKWSYENVTVNSFHAETHMPGGDDELYSYGTTDLTENESPLEEGKIYFVI